MRADFRNRRAPVLALLVLVAAGWVGWVGWGWWRSGDLHDAPDPSGAATLIGSADGVSPTLSVLVRDRTWLAFSKRDEVLGQDLVFWTSPEPTGPFTPTAPVGRLPSDAATGTLRFLPLAHADVVPVPGTRVISYSRNRTDAGEVFDDPTLYRPRFLSVPLPATP